MVLGVLFGLAAPAAAATPAQSYAPVGVVHQERLAVGPYPLTVGFSVWPVRARQSLDFTFEPEDGIGRLRGTLVAVAPSGDRASLRRPAGVEGLPRHPRRPEVWGLDVLALDEPGDWVFRFGLDGPRGPATAELVVPVLDQPGPPLALSWVVSTGPLAVIVVLLGTAVRRGAHTQRVRGVPPTG